MGVPFIDIKRFEPGFLDAWQGKVAEMSANAAFIGGEEVQKLESNLAKFTEVSYAISCANGTDALQVALRALGVGPGDKVLLPDSTFWATFEAVVNVGATPYTVDTNLEDLQMDFSEFEKAVEKENFKAAILVHLYGWGSNRLEDFRQLCKKKNIMLLEDGAQSFGVRYKGDSVYKGALISTTSFYPAKVLGAAGDGGAVFTSDSDLAERVRMLCNHGRTSHYGHGDVGWNSRMDSLQAAFVNLALDHLPERIQSRREYAKKYYEKLPGKGIRVIQPPTSFEENGYCNVTLIEPEKRTELQEKLKSKGIGFGVIYPGAMSDQPGAKKYLGGRIGKEHRTSRICQSVLNFPLFPYISEEEFQEVLDAL